MKKTHAKNINVFLVVFLGKLSNMIIAVFSFSPKLCVVRVRQFYEFCRLLSEVHSEEQ